MVNFDELEQPCPACKGTGSGGKSFTIFGWKWIKTPCMADGCHGGKVLTDEGRQFLKFLCRHLRYNSCDYGVIEIKR